jgi:excisionase family DNA binding protein
MDGKAAEALVDDGVMDLWAAAEFTGLGRSKLYELMDAGQLPFVRIGRTRRIPRRALVRLLVSGLVGGHAAPPP